MGLFIEERLDELNALFGTTWKKAPTWVGIWRFLLKIDPTAIEDVVRLHAEKQLPSTTGIRFIAMDGKALRGSASRVMDLRARHWYRPLRRMI